MKNTIKFSLLLFSFSTFLFVSCTKEDDKLPPQINGFELGYENSGIAYLGSDLHLEAEILSDAKIDRITLLIHHEGEHGKKSTYYLMEEGEWEIDTTYTKFTGLKNTSFHEHFDVPLEIETGEYHLDFAVIDMDGNKTEIERDLIIEAPVDLLGPELTIDTHPAAMQVFTNGQVITISGKLADETALGGVYVGLVRENQNLADAAVDATNTITLLHTHDFQSPVTHEFSASITVGAAQDNNSTPKPIDGDIAWQSGNYYILVKVKDAFGGNWTFSQHYPIEIQQ